MGLIEKLSNLIRGLGKTEKPQMPKEWFGSYLDEDGIVADVFKRISEDEESTKLWLDPWSWKFPYLGSRIAQDNAPEHAGCLIWADRGIRNYYGLWHADNPHTAFGADDDVEITDGIITDPRHPDNFSDRVVQRVKKALADKAASDLCHGSGGADCKCFERMGNDFYFLPKGECLFKKEAA